jgi:glycosyltransferase involved in cell wall biosynthesis
MDIVICDGGSTDDTLTIAKEYGCKTIEQDRRFKNPNNTIADFSGVRNQQLAAAKYDWFMFIDSDEYISKELAEEIRGVVVKNAPKPMIFNVPRKYVKDGQVIDCAVTYPNYQTRFFNKKAANGFIRKVHEKIDLKEGQIIEKLTYNEYVPLESVSDLKQKWAKYLAIEQEQESNERLSGWFVNGLLYHMAVSVLYVFRYVKILLFCKGNKMPFSYEVLRLWYNIEVIKVGFWGVVRKRKKILLER